MVKILIFLYWLFLILVYLNTTVLHCRNNIVEDLIQAHIHYFMIFASLLGVRCCAQVQAGGRSWKKNIWMVKGEQNSKERTWPNDPFVTVPAAIWPLVKVDRGMSVALHSSMSTASCLLGTAIWKDLAFVIRPGLHLPTMHSWKSDKDPVSNTGLGWWEEPAMISYHQHWHQRLSSPQESSFSIRLLLSSVPLSGNTVFFISAFLFICVSLGGGAELCHLRAPNRPDLTEITLQHGHTPLERPRGQYEGTGTDSEFVVYYIMRFNYYQPVYNAFLVKWYENIFARWKPWAHLCHWFDPLNSVSAHCC